MLHAPEAETERGPGRREDRRWTIALAIISDTERYELRRAGMVVKLRPKVFEVLAYLIAHRERLIAKQELLEQLWPQQFVGERPGVPASGRRARRWAIRGRASGSSRRATGGAFASWRSSWGMARSGRDVHPGAGPGRPGRPVPGGPVVVPEDQERGEVERPTAAGVDAEHKPVTVLSAGLVDATGLAAQLGPEAMHRLMQACLATVERVLPQYGGTLTHITGEGFVALFGAPLAHEDHARRAVLAAVALQQALQERAGEVSPAVALGIGVHTGPVVVGSLGARATGCIPQWGRLSPLAGQLQQRAAPSAILLSAATHQLVQAEVQVDDGGTLGVAEEVAPGPVYQVRGIARRRSGVLGRGGRALSRFVGRERELAICTSACACHPGAGAGARHCRRARHR